LNDWQARKGDLECDINRIEALTPDKYMLIVRELLELSKQAFSLYRGR